MHAINDQFDAIKRAKEILRESGYSYGQASVVLIGHQDNLWKISAMTTEMIEIELIIDDDGSLKKLETDEENNCKDGLELNEFDVNQNTSITCHSHDKSCQGESRKCNHCEKILCARHFDGNSHLIYSCYCIQCGKSVIDGCTHGAPVWDKSHIVSDKQLDTQNDVWIQKGNEFEESGDYVKAIQCYEEVLRTEPNNIEALNMIGYALNSIGKNTEAVDVFERVLEIDPKNIHALITQAAVHVRLQNSHIALERINEALQIEPDNSDILFWKAMALAALKKDEDAIIFYDKVLKNDSEHSEAIFRKGVSLFHLNNYDEAIKYFDMALNLDPEHVDVLFYKGLSLRNMGMYSDALNCFRLVLELNPDTPSIREAIDSCEERM